MFLSLFVALSQLKKQIGDLEARLRQAHSVVAESQRICLLEQQRLEKGRKQDDALPTGGFFRFCVLFLLKYFVLSLQDQLVFRFSFSF